MQVISGGALEVTQLSYYDDVTESIFLLVKS
jgi:hypothetical protein